MDGARDDPQGAIILHGWFGGASTGARRLMDGSWWNGSWAEKVIVPTENVVALPEERLRNELGYTLPQLVWINELLVPYGGLLAAWLRPGACVIVAPATGHFGAAAIQVALALGTRKMRHSRLELMMTRRIGASSRSRASTQQKFIRSTTRAR